MIHLVTTVTLPSARPESPEWMSYSRLHEIEDCPRRWSLRNSSYAEIWGGHGYPEPLSVPATQGRVVHLSVERLVRQLSESGCTSAKSGDAVAVLRSIGGYSALIELCIDELLDAEAGNPRAAPTLARARRALRSNVPAIRRVVQGMLSRRVIIPRERGATSQPVH